MLKPVEDRIVVRMVELKESSPIILPDQVKKEMPIRARVLAVGPGRLLDNGTREPIPVEVGALIIFHRFSGTIIRAANGEPLVIIRLSDVLCIDPDAEAMVEEGQAEEADILAPVEASRIQPLEGQPRKKRGLFGSRG